MTWTKQQRGGRGLRVRPGEQNATEASYEAAVLRPAKERGELLDFWFQSWSFKLGEDCRWTPDFVVQYASGLLGIREIKGSRKIKKAGEDPAARLGSKAFLEDHARVKIRVFATKFPLEVLIAYQKRKYEGGGWAHEDHSAWSDPEHQHATPPSNARDDHARLERLARAEPAAEEADLFGGKAS